MTRRKLLSMLAAIPLVGRLVPQPRYRLNAQDAIDAHLAENTKLALKHYYRAQEFPSLTEETLRLAFEATQRQSKAFAANPHVEYRGTVRKLADVPKEMEENG